MVTHLQSVCSLTASLNFPKVGSENLKDEVYILIMCGACMVQFFSSLQGKIFMLVIISATILVGLGLFQWRFMNLSADQTAKLVSLERDGFERKQKFLKALTLSKAIAESESTQPLKEKENFTEVLAEIRSYASTQSLQGLGEISDLIGRLTAVGPNSEQSNGLRKQLQDSIAKEATLLAADLRTTEASLSQVERASSDINQRNLILLAFAIACGICASGFAGYVLSKSTASRLNKLVQEQTRFLKSVQDGNADLSKVEFVDSQDEISQLQNAFMALREAYGSLIYSIRDTGQRLEGMIQEDLSHFSDLANATEEMGTTARTIATTALNISEAATSTADASRRGRSLLQSTAHELKEAADRVREGVARMESLANKVREVALNAAIEASRAGDAGKGFAVVAEEVRKLALQTSKSAENVIGLVQGIQDETQEAVKLIQLIESESSNAASGANTSQATFESISENSADLAKSIHGIASATEEQRATVETMGSRIAELFQNVEHSLRPQLKDLVKTVENFKVDATRAA